VKNKQGKIAASHFILLTHNNNIRMINCSAISSQSCTLYSI